jgi:hypothetical protein
LFFANDLSSRTSAAVHSLVTLRMYLGSFSPLRARSLGVSSIGSKSARPDVVRLCGRADSESDFFRVVVLREFVFFPLLLVLVFAMRASKIKYV